MQWLLMLVMSGLMMACAQAAPPVQVTPDEIEIVGAEETPPPAKLPEQPAALVEALKKLQEGSLDAQIKALVEKARQDMVYVEGGEFLMGDFGHLDSVEKLPYTSQPYNKPLHKVVLDSFSISKYKVTYAEYDVYTRAKGLPLIETARKFASEFRKPSAPAGVPWQGAKDYCAWLGKVSKLPFDLPTEAQWEYAARARGQFLVFPTNDGYYREDVNVSSYRTREIIGNGWDIYPIGLYPANPLGLYDLAGNGSEWMNDWFGENTYKEAAHYKNPTGPQSGTKKVVRGLDAGNTDTAMSMYRRKASPIFKPHVLSGVTFPPSYAGNAFRCALQQPKAIH